MQYKGLCIILDGLGDKPQKKLNGKTPLEAAKTPHFDALIKRGQGALVHTLASGVPVGTHTGTAILFGLAAKQAQHLNRGPVEAAGIGLKLAAGDIAIRCNFATVKQHKGQFDIIDRRAGRIDKATKKLSKVLQNIKLDNKITASIHPATQHRAIVHLRGKNLSAHISDTDPNEMGDQLLVAKTTRKKNKAAIKTAAALNQLTDKVFQRLHRHPVNKKREKNGLLPANAILTRGAGQAFKIHSLLSQLKLKVAVISAERTVSGLARLFHYTAIEDPRFTALTNTDLNAKVAAAQRALQQHDLVYLHIKATDICSHDRNPLAKKQFIEKIDRALKPLLKQKDKVIGVVSDHSTDCNTGRHSGATVPAILTAPQGRKDACRRFSECACDQGELGHISGMAFLLNMLDEMGYLGQFTEDMADFIE